MKLQVELLQKDKEYVDILMKHISHAKRELTGIEVLNLNDAMTFLFKLGLKIDEALKPKPPIPVMEEVPEMKVVKKGKK